MPTTEKSPDEMPTTEKSPDKMPTFGWHFVRLAFCPVGILSYHLYEHSDLSELSDSEDSGLDPPLLFLPTAVRIIQLH